jgi:XTP/dITP diphosphohydrolase
MGSPRLASWLEQRTRAAAAGLPASKDGAGNAARSPSTIPGMAGEREDSGIVGPTCVLATRNEHKWREFERLIQRSAPGGGPRLQRLPADVILPPEDGDTFAENALGKARAAAHATTQPTIADDSGIAAAALGGAPGVRSARYAGEDASDEQNLAKLLREAPEGSPLEYVCVIAYVDPREGVERLFEGRCAGRLDRHPRGDRGFGYDPAFLPDEGPPGQTMAELSDAEKDAISHRGHATRALVEWLRLRSTHDAPAGGNAASGAT